ncbi:hypothetical protein FACS1894203_4640 [Bacteroidia bacterium]|nr:hypothetical protein FACS1894203_4640 [Bacteroidia bacterium]
MPVSSGKISNSILWLCMMVTVGVFAFFYFSGSVDPGSEVVEPKQTSLLLYWVNIIFLFSVAVLFFFSFYRFYRKMKDNPRNAWRSLIMFLSLIVIWVIFYSLGDDTPVNIPGYDGMENIPVWLKLADMWLYSIYFLVGITTLSVFFGIIWSYIKKIK